MRLECQRDRKPFFYSSFKSEIKNNMLCVQSVSSNYPTEVINTQLNKLIFLHPRWLELTPISSFLTHYLSRLNENLKIRTEHRAYFLLVLVLIVRGAEERFLYHVDTPTPSRDYSQGSLFQQFFGNLFKRKKTFQP